MSKVLVVYGSKTGSTEGIAEQIGKTLSAMGLRVEVVPAEEAPQVAGFDAVIVGSGVRAGMWHRCARDWVVENADRLRDVPLAFFTCGLTLAQDPTKTEEVRAYTNPVIEATGVCPVDVGTFAGCHQPKKLPWAERTILKFMKAPIGDFRDFKAIADWAGTVAVELGLPDYASTAVAP